MSNLHNDMILENMADEVSEMSNAEIAFELGQPWRALALRSNAREQLIEELVNQRLDLIGGPHG